MGIFFDLKKKICYNQEKGEMQEWWNVKSIWTSCGHGKKKS